MKAMKNQPCKTDVELANLLHGICCKVAGEIKSISEFSTDVADFTKASDFSKWYGKLKYQDVVTFRMNCNGDDLVRFVSSDGRFKCQFQRVNCFGLYASHCKSSGIKQQEVVSFDKGTQKNEYVKETDGGLIVFTDGEKRAEMNSRMTVVCAEHGFSPSSLKMVGLPKYYMQSGCKMETCHDGKEYVDKFVKRCEKNVSGLLSGTLPDGEPVRRGVPVSEVKPLFKCYDWVEVGFSGMAMHRSVFGMIGFGKAKSFDIYKIGSCFLIDLEDRTYWVAAMNADDVRKYGLGKMSAFAG